MPDLTPRQTQTLDALEVLGGTATSRQIADQLGWTARSASAVLQWLRGTGLVKDNSTSTPLGGRVMLHSVPRGPTVWTKT